jgi:hypothetical protein
LSSDERRRGLIAASTGSHGQSESSPADSQSWESKSLRTADKLAPPEHALRGRYETDFR